MPVAPSESGRFATELAGSLTAGAVLTPGSDEWTAATSPDNSSFQQHPATVVRPATSADVAATVQTARAAGLRVAVQATGHGAGGPIDAGVVLVDTSALDRVGVDAGARTVRVGAGALWSAVQAQLEPHGLLALSGTSPTVGVTGYTVQGGVGWLVRPHGLASGALRAVEFVDGTGAVRRVDDDSPAAADREALWAFRGGAPAGIATELEFDVFEVPQLWAGFLLWPVAHLTGLLTAWLAALGSADPALTSTFGVLQLPPEGPFPEELLGTVVVHLSYASPDGEGPLAGLRAAMTAVAAPAVDTTGPADAARLSSIHLDPPAAVPARGMGEWLSTPDAGQVEAVVAAARIGGPNGLNMIELRHVAASGAGPLRSGALTVVPGPFLLHAVGAAPDDRGRADVDGVLERVAAAAGPVGLARSAPAFREGQPGTGDAYPAAELARLRDVVSAGDPDGVFAFHRVPGRR